MGFWGGGGVIKEINAELIGDVFSEFEESSSVDAT